MTKCYYCGKTDGSHDISCICGKPTPPAMNAASPTEHYTCIGKGGAYKLIGTAIGAGTSRGSTVVVYQDTDDVWYFRTESDFAERMVPIAAPVDQGSAALDSQRWSKEAEMIESWSGQGSATSGEELPSLPQPFGSIDVYHDDATVRSVDGFTADQMRGYAIDYGFQLGRAALAAKAEQSAPAVMTQELYDLLIKWAGYNIKRGYSDATKAEAEAELLAHIGSIITAPVAERAAAPASVPEGQCTEDQRNAVYMALHYYMKTANPDEWKATDEAIAAFLAAAPEVAQPAAQGESIDTPEFRKLVDEHHSEAFSYQAEYRDAKEFPEWRALVAHINAWGNSLATPAPTAGEPSACATCPKETLYGPAICGKCVEAGESSVDEVMVVGHEFLKWNRAQKPPPVAGCKELYIARKVLELRAAHIKATQGGKDGA